MAGEEKNPNLVSLFTHLAGHPDARRRGVGEKDLPAPMAMLRRWQSERLASTYADLLADPAYAAAGRFFLSDIYAPRDFSQRDHDFEHLHDLLSRFLPPPMLQILTDAIALNRVSASLDQSLLKVLAEDLGVTDSISPQQYAQAYRICDNYLERKVQIDLLAQILKEVGAGARLPAVGLTLRLVRVPAIKAGWFELHDFLARGYSAFKPMRKPEYFSQVVYLRETDLLERIFAGHEDPFAGQSSSL